MKVLGIDPGFQVTGYALISKQGSLTSLHDYGFLRMKSTDHLSVRVGQFYNFFQQKIMEQGVTHLALETSFLGKNAQTFLKLGYLRGVLYLLANQHRLQLREFAPTEVKAAVTGTGSASKEQVAYLVQRLFPTLQKQTHLKLDVTDALAVALCGMMQESKFALQARLLQMKTLS